MTDAIHQAIRAKLKRIYGDEVGQQTYQHLGDLLQPIAEGTVGQLAISEKDVMLICYGDHVGDGEHPPLQVLHQFLARQVPSVIQDVHILPFFPASSDDGFSVIDYYQVDPALGDWSHIQAMRASFRLMFDAVFNHVSTHSNWFKSYLAGDPSYADYFIDVPPDTDLSAVVRPRALPLLTPFETAQGKKHVWTTFSDDQVDLNAGNPAVLLELLKVLRFYVSQGAQFIRLDAIAFLWKEIGTSCIHLEETHLIIQLMRDVLNIIAPDVVLITETNVPHEENISYFGDGTNEAQMVYQFPLPPLILHTLATGDTTRLTQWAQSLESPGERTTFFNFTASHDGIGLRPVTGILTAEEIDALAKRTIAHGGRVSFKANSDGSESAYEMNITYFDAITHPDITAADPTTAVNRFIVSQAIQLSLAGMPGIYFSSLFGGRNWQEGVTATGRARTINRQKHDIHALEKLLVTEGTLARRVFRRYQSLLAIRRQQKAMHPLGQQLVLDVGGAVFAIQRTSPDGEQTLLALHNVTGKSVTVKLPTGTWHDLLTAETAHAKLELEPYRVAWLTDRS